MKKKYRFSLEFTIDIHDEDLGRIKERNKKMDAFLLAFIQDDQVLLNYFKRYFLDTFEMETHFQKVSRQIQAQDEKEIIASVTDRTSAEVSEYINGLFNPDSSNLEISDNMRVAAREFFYNQFSSIMIDQAQFIEID